MGDLLELLRWNNRRSIYFRTQYLNASTADFFFICSGEAENEDERIPAHKIILGSVSGVFHAMFYGSLPEKSEIEITDVTATGLKQFLYFFYDKKVIFTIDHVHEVLYLSEKYDVPKGSLACCEFLIERGHESFKTTNFLNCSQTILRTILQNVYLKGEGEMLFKACMDWASNSCSLFELDIDMDNIRKMLGDCLDLIEFASIKRTKAIEYLKEYPSFFKVDEATFERVKAYDDKNSQWPFYEATDNVSLQKGKPLTMKFEANQSCLLHTIGFPIRHFLDGMDNDKFTILVSIEKTEGTEKKKKRKKLFVGTLSFEYDPDVKACLSTLPDVIVIDPFLTYAIKIIPFQRTRIGQVAGLPKYNRFDGTVSSVLKFKGSNFALLKITLI